MKIQTKIISRKKNFLLEIELETEFSSLGVFGSSGAGKSSLLNLIAGLEKPDSGFLKIDVDTFFDIRAGIFLEAHLRKTTMVFQDIRLFPHINVRDNILFGTRKMRNPQTVEKLNRISEILGISHILNNFPSQISGGEAQRVAIARAIMSSPRLLLLDEPFSHLDCKNRENAINRFKELKNFCSCPKIIVSHNPWDLIQLCDKIVEMKDGKIFRLRSVKDFFLDESLICPCKRQKEFSNPYLFHEKIAG